MIRGLLPPYAQVPVLITHQKDLVSLGLSSCLAWSFNSFFPRTHVCLWPCCLVNAMTLPSASVGKSCSRIHHKPGVTCLLRLRHVKYVETQHRNCFFCLLVYFPSPTSTASSVYWAISYHLHMKRTSLPNSWVTQSNSSICSAATFPKTRDVDLRAICFNYSKSIPEHDISEDALGNPRWRVWGGSELQNGQQSVHSLKSYLLPSIWQALY